MNIIMKMQGIADSGFLVPEKEVQVDCVIDIKPTGLGLSKKLASLAKEHCSIGELRMLWGLKKGTLLMRHTNRMC